MVKGGLAAVPKLQGPAPLFGGAGPDWSIRKW